MDSNKNTSGFCAEISQKNKVRNWALSAFYDAATALSKAKSIDSLIKDVCIAISTKGPYVLAWVGRAEDDDQKTITVVGGSGVALPYIENILLSWSDQVAIGLGPGGVAIRTGKTSLIYDTEQDEGFIAWRKRAEDFHIRSAIGCVIPELDKPHPYGVLLVYSTIPQDFGEFEVLVFESLAKEIGFGIRLIERQNQLSNEILEKVSAQERLSQTLRSTIEAMSKTMEWRDSYTAHHQKKVAIFSRAIAKKLGYSEDALQSIYMAAMVHDIGKIAIPAEILSKPSRLTDLEMEMVKGHVLAGYEILKEIPFSLPIAEIVYQHHERLDGSGYPRGLKGDEICKEARILAVADILEAMSSHRPYRPAKGWDAAIQEIKNQSGTKLDETVVNAVLQMESENDGLQKLISLE